MSFDPAAAAAWMEAVGVTRVTPFRELLIAVSNPGKSDRLHNWFAQCGHTESKMDWLFEQLREPKVVNLNASHLSLAVSLAIKSM